MNPSDLENELRSLKPTDPGANLEAAIACELKQARQPATAGVIPREKETFTARLLNGLSWAMGGAALVVIAIVCFNVARTTPDRVHVPITKVEPASPDSYEFEPVESSRELVDAEEGDLVDAPEDGPSRIVKYSSRERHVWANPNTGAQVVVEVPRQDVMLVPVSFQ